MANNVDTKYGEVTTEHGEFIDGEPVIVFRARDENLIATLADYREKCVASGSPPHHIALIDDTITRIEDWQHENADKVVVPNSNRWAERTGQVS